MIICTDVANFEKKNWFLKRNIYIYIYIFHKLGKTTIKHIAE